MRHPVHGESHRTSEYRSWKKMRERCLCSTCKDYPDYGGRGITICADWSDYLTFLRDMGRKPSPQHSIGRKNNDGPYCRDNCEWQTPSEQARNRRTSRFVTYNGATLTIAGWAERIGISPLLLADRLRNPRWSLERAMGAPRWETRRQVSRRKADTIFVRYDGATMSLAEYAERAGLKYYIAYCRLKRRSPLAPALASSDEVSALFASEKRSIPWS